MRAEAHVGRTTMAAQEGLRTPVPNNLAAIRQALEKGGVEFIDQNGTSPGVQLKKP